MRSNKKGNMIIEIFGVLLVGVILVIGVVAFISANDELSDEVLKDDFINDSSHNVSKQIITKNQINAPKSFDYIPLTVMIILIIGSAVSAWFTKTHPVFLFVAIIPFVVLILAGALMGAALEETEADFEGSSTTLPITSWLISNFVVILVFGGLLILLTGLMGWRSAG